MKRKFESVNDTKAKKVKLRLGLPWKNHEFLSEIENLDLDVSLKVIELFEDECTVPFIARYRQEVTGGLKPERLRQIKDSYEWVKELKTKANNLERRIKSVPEVDEFVINRIKCAKTIEELDLIAAPFQKQHNGTLSSRAKKLGLDEPAELILSGMQEVNFSRYIQRKEGLQDVKQVAAGVQHIVADIIAKDVDVLHYVETLKRTNHIVLECAEKKKNNNERNREKYQHYFRFSQPVNSIQDYQVLAINRGEREKCLNVKIIIPPSFWNCFKTFCKQKWMSAGEFYPNRSLIFEASMDDAISRLVTPMVCRQIRKSLTQAAEKSAISVFESNLKALLLTKPFRGKVIMGIDPGAINGCKVAIISPNSNPLYFTKLFVHDKSILTKNALELKSLLMTYGCETIAIGNGYFCRNVEQFIADLIAKRFFMPLDVNYTIVDEQGVSIYSCSDAALDEFPNVEPTEISAISLARRLQDPLSELVKVDPKHLGVGMYQHDVPEKKLTSTLEDVVSECVSFVGVDVNIGSIHLLKRLAGMNESKGKAIIKRRQEHGPFKSREELKKVKGVGEKTFKQIAGFIRIIPATASLQNKATFNPLDNTEVHPEHYDVAKRLLKIFKLNIYDMGKEEFITDLSNAVVEYSYENLSELLGINILTLKQITDALSQPVDFDVRSLSNERIFRKGFTTIESLKVGNTLTGVVRNVTTFGAFVDIGVEADGLIFGRNLDEYHDLKVGVKVQVRVSLVDISRKRISLKLIGIIL